MVNMFVNQWFKYANLRINYGITMVNISLMFKYGLTSW